MKPEGENRFEAKSQAAGLSFNGDSLPACKGLPTATRGNANYPRIDADENRRGAAIENRTTLWFDT